MTPPSDFFGSLLIYTVLVSIGLVAVLKILFFLISLFKKQDSQDAAQQQSISDVSEKNPDAAQKTKNTLFQRCSKMFSDFYSGLCDLVSTQVTLPRPDFRTLVLLNKSLFLESIFDEIDFLDKGNAEFSETIRQEARSFLLNYKPDDQVQRCLLTLDRAEIKTLYSNTLKIFKQSSAQIQQTSQMISRDLQTALLNQYPSPYGEDSENKKLWIQAMERVVSEFVLKDTKSLSQFHSLIFKGKTMESGFDGYLQLDAEALFRNSCLNKFVITRWSLNTKSDDASVARNTANLAIERIYKTILPKIESFFKDLPSPHRDQTQVGRSGLNV